jgi:hypothetical protein
MELSWRNVLDPKIPMTQDETLKLAKAAGYQFFAWEGAVYTVVETEHAGVRANQIASVGNVS